MMTGFKLIAFEVGRTKLTYTYQHKVYLSLKSSTYIHNTYNIPEYLILVQLVQCDHFLKRPYKKIQDFAFINCSKPRIRFENI